MRSYFWVPGMAIGVSACLLGLMFRFAPLYMTSSGWVSVSEGSKICSSPLVSWSGQCAQLGEYSDITWLLIIGGAVLALFCVMMRRRDS